ncbi:MAG: NADH-quinone oxidoreductase subunit NuoG [Candidatus Omnitrophica bacterium]|nr:NADH-quinone oxidoreductase subunit NuoG [Candidatus Omnitrophota bacterium]
MSQTGPEMVTLTIDGRQVTVPKGTPIIDAALQLGIDIPHYCYDKDLSVVASCRLCLVEIEKVPKLQPSCSTPAAEGQVVYTRSDKVLDARRMQMEFLLVQHPLDCPVCDQGGECKLQDYSREHGAEDTRFHYRRRTFPKPDIGPFIDLERNRCILCSRCVRFMDEIAGNAELVVVNRGWKSHITTFQDQPLKNEFAGNTIDLCPVGALTSKVTRFRTRVWELKSKPSICSLCSVGCSIDLQHRNRTREILRVLPRLSEKVNYRWICDIGRFGFDQFNSDNRLKKPAIRINGDLQETSWANALGEIAKKLKVIVGARGGAAAGGIIGPRPSNETLFLFQQFFREILKSNNVDHRTEFIPGQQDDGFLTSIALRAVNQPFEEIRKASAVILLGTDLPNELPILHLQVRERASAGIPVYLAHHRPTRLDSVCSGVWGYRPGFETPFLADLLKKTAQKMESLLSQEMEETISSFLPGAENEAAGVSEQQVNELANILQQSNGATLLVGESMFTGKAGPVNVRLAAELAHLLSSDVGGPPPLSLLPLHNNSRGAADMGCYPHRGPGFEPIEKPGRNTAQMLEGCIDGSLQALILFNADLLNEYPDRDLARRALEKVPFLVVADAYPFSTIPYADIALPLSTHAEEDGTYTNVDGRIQRALAAVAQLEGALTGVQAILALGERWGAGWRQVNPSRIFEMIARAVPHYKDASWTDAGKGRCVAKPVNISLFQTSLSLAASSLASSYKPPLPDYPFRLVRGRFLFDDSGEKRFAPSLVSRREECWAEMHPGDAKKIGVHEGVMVSLEGVLGSIRLPARISNAAAPGCVTVLGRYDDKPVNGLTAEDQPWIKVQL